MESYCLPLISISGLRGVLPLVLVFPFDESIVSNKELFLQLVISSILFTIIVNTNLVNWLVKKLQINKLTPVEEIEQLLTEIILLKSMIDKLGNSRSVDEICEETYFQHLAELKAKIKEFKAQVFLKLKDESASSFKNELIRTLKRYFLHVEKSVYGELNDKQIISNDLLDGLYSSISLQLDLLEEGKTQFKNERVNLEIKRKKLKSITISTNSIVKRITAKTENHIIKDIYLYYKARVLGDERVIEEMGTFFEKNIKLFSHESLKNVKETYTRLMKESKEILDLTKEKYPELVMEIDEEIYQKELKNFKNMLAKEFTHSDRISDRALKEICL